MTMLKPLTADDAQDTGPGRSRRVIRTSLIGAAFAVTLLGACSSDTAALEVGDCVHVEAGDFTIGGDTDSVPCSEVEFLSDNYRVVAVGSESEMDAACSVPDLIIVDGDDAACLSQ